MFNLSNDRTEVEQIDGLNLSSWGLMGCVSPYTMFKDIFNLEDNLLDSPTQTQLFEYRCDIAKRILITCGLSESYAENYAKNIIYSETRIAFGGDVVHYIPITAESFATFRDSFDEINGLDYDPTYQ